MWIAIMLAFILGTIVGSFLNVCVMRMNTGQGLGGRSWCDACSRQLRWHELIPIASFIAQGGACRTCKSRLSLQYPVVECVTGIVFALIAFQIGIATVGAATATLVLWIFASYAIVAAVYDIRHTVIPVSGILFFLCFGALLLFLPSIGTWPLVPIAFSLPQPSAILAGIAIPLPFFLVWLLSRGKLFGLGDVELMIPIGFSLGLAQGAICLLFAFWSATIVVCVVSVMRPRLFRNRAGGIMKQAIPFGPFLLASWLFMLVSGTHVMTWLSSFVI